MMKDAEKTKAQLIEELEALRESGTSIGGLFETMQQGVVFQDFQNTPPVPILSAAVEAMMSLRALFHSLTDCTSFDYIDVLGYIERSRSSHG